MSEETTKRNRKYRSKKNYSRKYPQKYVKGCSNNISASLFGVNVSIDLDNMQDEIDRFNSRKQENKIKEAKFKKQLKELEDEDEEDYQ